MKANRMWLFSDVLEKNKRVFKVPVYQKAINFNGSEIYVSTQFFDSDRDAVIDWYRSHL